MLSPFHKEDELTDKKDKPSTWFHRWLDDLIRQFNDNESSISTNTTNIATNASDIATLQTQSPTLGTPVTLSGTEVEFTGIPSWVTRIVISIAGLSTNGSDTYLIQIGDSGGPEATGYSGAFSAIGSASTPTSNATTGFAVASSGVGTSIHGQVTLTLMDESSFTWVASGVLARSDGAAMRIFAGSKSLSAALDRIIFTTTGGTNTFDAGEANIWYE